ncbi:MAG TPA: lipopolysaccharide assembly protein LapA domain-containing protein [Acidobacteriota bacterium]|jgi:uncharacterized integral membrane protein
MRVLKALLLTLVLAGASWFAGLNVGTTVTVQLPIQRVYPDVPLLLLLFGSVLLGIVIAGAVSIPDVLRRRSELRRLRRQLRALESEVRSLRNLPITDSFDEADSGSA